MLCHSEVVLTLCLALSPPIAQGTDVSLTVAKGRVQRRGNGLNTEKFHFKEQLDLLTFLCPSLFGPPSLVSL